MRTCKNLLLALAGDTLPEDMEAREPAKAVALWPNTRFTLQRMLLGASVVGEKYQLTNTGVTELAVAAPDLFKPGVMAVNIEHTSLQAGHATSVFADPGAAHR